MKNNGFYKLSLLLIIFLIIISIIFINCDIYRTKNFNNTDTSPTPLGVIKFADKNLEKIIREEIGIPKGYIYRNELLAITKLSLSTKTITNLSGLEYCTNLSVLAMSYELFSDITPLSSLVNLKELHIGFCDGFWWNLAPLSYLVNLEILTLRRCNISNISFLENLCIGLFFKN